MSERILFLTGRMAEPALTRVLSAIDPPPFRAEVRHIGIKVAGLMTTDMVRRRVEAIGDAERILLPGRCRGDVAALGEHFGVPVERGPEELKDLPAFFGRGGRAPDLSRHDTRIFAEIVDAPHLTVAGLVARAAGLRAQGADVIDLGCLPGTPFPHLEGAVSALKAEGHRVSVDSMDTGELRRGSLAGADYLLSLTEETLWLADEVPSTPVLIPAAGGGLESLARAMEPLLAAGRPFIADPILDPIHYGFADSLARYRELRRRYPEAEILMGTGNVSELTDADTTGIHALLFGICSELGIRQVLTTNVSPHCRDAVREADRARRVMFAAREAQSLPRGWDNGLLGLRDRRPFPDTPAEVAELAAQVRDRNYRVQVSEAGIHLYNRDGLHCADDPFALWPHIDVAGDAGHAFYLGVELARAQIAWQLGKRYRQDQELQWGCAARPEGEQP